MLDLQKNPFDQLIDLSYQEISHSQLLPDLHFELLAQFIQTITETKNQTQAIIAYRNILRTETKTETRKESQ